MDLFYARGRSQRHLGRLKIRPSVLNAKMILGPNMQVSVDDHREEDNENIFLINTKRIHQASLVTLQLLLSASHYSFSVDELQPTLNDLNQMSRSFPRKFNFNCVQRPTSNRELCELFNRDTNKNTICIKGKIKGHDAQLKIEHQGSMLEVSGNQSEPKHIEIIHYNNTVVLDHTALRLQKVVKPIDYNLSYYHNNIVKHRMLPNWLILKFSANNRDNLLHHFKYDNVANKVNINGVNHVVQDHRIYVTLDDGIDGNKLLRLDDKRTIAVFVDSSLKNSTISMQEGVLNINNATLSNLPDKTTIIFQESENKTLPVSYKLLSDSFNPTRSKRETGERLNELVYGQVSIRSSLREDAIAHSPSIATNTFEETDTALGMRAHPNLQSVGASTTSADPCTIVDVTLAEDRYPNLQSVDAPIVASATSGASKSTSWLGNVWQFGKHLMRKVMDSYNQLSADTLQPYHADHHTTSHLDKQPYPTSTFFKDLSATTEATHLALIGHDQPGATKTGPTMLEADTNGLLTWGVLLARKWTAYHPKAFKTPSYDLAIDKNGIDIPSSIRSHELVDTFMNKVQEHTQACGIEASNILDNAKLYTQAIETVRRKLAKEELDTVAEHLFEQVVQKNISKLASKSTPDQADQLLASIRQELPNIQQQFLQQEVSLQNHCQEEDQANTTPKADINRLKQEICSMKLTDQVADLTLCSDKIYNRNYSISPNDIDHGSPYRKCGSL